MNVGVELSVELTGLQKAVRQSSLSAAVFCCIHMNFLRGIFCIFYPLSIPSLSRMWGCVCLCPVYIGSDFVMYPSVSLCVKVLSVCDCMPAV